MRVLCYSPYNRWALHGQWEMTILHGLRRRGADVHYVLCDGLYTDCDVFWQATEPRPPLACVQCQAEVAGLVARMGMEYEWLGRWVTPAELREARRWEQSLSADDLSGARYGDWHVAAWVVGSVHSDLRRSQLDTADERVERSFRSYLYSGLVACFALDRLLEESRPDVLLLFNGRQSSLRVAFELARARGVRVVCHERGQRPETLFLTVDEKITSLEPVHRTWDEWGGVPLTTSQLQDVQRLLSAREHGGDLPCPAYAPPPQPAGHVREELGLDPARPTWVLFTSSDDELVADDSWYGFFPSQLDWIDRTVEFAGRHPALQLVIRVHPNTGGRRSVGANTQQLEQMRALAQRCPPNVRVVGADEDVSSYTLMEIGDVGLTYGSTAGFEMACKGKAVVVACRSWLSGLPFAHTAREPERYDELLERMLDVEPETVDTDVRRLAYRFAYGQYFRLQIPFPLVRMSSPSLGTPAWTRTDELDPGSDAGLDRIVGVILDGAPIVVPPTDEDRARSGEHERAFFSGERPLTVLAFADELVEDASLLAAWGGAISGSDPATLVISTPPGVTEVLVRAVGRAGLDGDGSAELVAVDDDLGSLRERVDAVFSRRPPPPELAGVPRFDDRALARAGG